MDCEVAEVVVAAVVGLAVAVLVAVGLGAVVVGLALSAGFLGVISEALVRAVADLEARSGGDLRTT